MNLAELRGETVPINTRAENNGIFISLACKSACAIIKSIAISPWTSALKDGWIRGGLACRWVRKLPTAAVLVQSKCPTCTPTCNHPSFLFSTNYLKLLWATCFISWLHFRGGFRFDHFISEAKSSCNLISYLQIAKVIYKLTHVDICSAACGIACSRCPPWCGNKRYIVAIYKADIIKI